MGRFKAKKKSNPILLYLIIVIIIFFLLNKFILKGNIDFKDTLLSYLVKDNLKDTDVNDIEFLLKYALNVQYEEKNEVEVIKPVSKIEAKDETPTIYLYSTHQSETYKSNYLSGYNIEATVFQASQILKEYLKDNELYAKVEESNLVKRRNDLGLSYGSSYKVSRMAMEEAYKNNSKLKYFFDIHRDSGSYDKTTISVGNIVYAKLLFVIGLDNSNYLINLSLAEKYRSKLNEIVPGICRGIVKKSGAGVNGIYNQDFSPNALLIEVGGENNTIEEVNNTMKVLALVISKIVGEE